MLMCFLFCFCFFRLRYLFFSSLSSMLEIPSSFSCSLLVWLASYFPVLVTDFLFSVFLQFGLPVFNLFLLANCEHFFYSSICLVFINFFFNGFDIFSLRTSNMYIKTILKALFCASVYLSKWKGMPANFID